jgi:hypothetical protein
MIEKGISWHTIAVGACGLVLVLASAIWAHLYACQIDTDKRLIELEKKEEVQSERWNFVAKKLEEIGTDLKRHVQDGK